MKSGKRNRPRVPAGQGDLSEGVLDIGRNASLGEGYSEAVLLWAVASRFEVTRLWGRLGVAPKLQEVEYRSWDREGPIVMSGERGVLWVDFRLHKDFVSEIAGALRRAIGPGSIVLVGPVSNILSQWRSSVLVEDLQASAHAVVMTMPRDGEIRLSFDENDQDAGFEFYRKHIFRYSALSRRLLGRLFLIGGPSVWLRALSNRWYVVWPDDDDSKSVPGSVTGNPDPAGTLKSVDWKKAEITIRSRIGGDVIEVSELSQGWNARRWVTWPLTSHLRHARLRRVFTECASLLRSRPSRAATEDEVSASLAQARNGFAMIEPELPPHIKSRVRAHLRGDRMPLTVVVEHGDFTLNNLLVESSGRKKPLEVRVVDANPDAELALPGRDALSLLLDSSAALHGCNGITLTHTAVWLEKLEAKSPGAVCDLLLADIEDCSAMESALVVGLLRHVSQHGTFQGLAGFLDDLTSARFEGLFGRVRYSSRLR